MDKQHAHQLLDQLDPGQLAAVGHLLEVMVDKTAPADDEPVTDEDRLRLAASQEYFRQGGEGISLEQVAADLGFTMDQIRDAQIRNHDRP